MQRKPNSDLRNTCLNHLSGPKRYTKQFNVSYIPPTATRYRFDIAFN